MDSISYVWICVSQKPMLKRISSQCAPSEVIESLRGGAWWEGSALGVDCFLSLCSWLMMSAVHFPICYYILPSDAFTEAPKLNHPILVMSFYIYVLNKHFCFINDLRHLFDYNYAIIQSI